ncbi:uncharacterized protein tp53i13 [Chanos chanos]|uniref:Uncharacterized protein tp53i13 n=1 Tax=Chanos chanos TaxID=29144 RepID=A0A6J2VPN9_CHACN|nr:tumor protein p53-inducible protein 13 [Chanos chanos]
MYFRLPSIDTKYHPKPAYHVCMDTPIIYNHSIPNNGAHRPVWAESGEYLYCPPQRWLHNLKHGAIVFLYHPCASVEGYGRLAAFAHSCLSHYILTAYPWLSKHRPFALVSWGRTLETSHVNALEICEWLLSVSSNISWANANQRPKYSLFLTKSASTKSVGTALRGTNQDLSQQDRIKLLRQCCEDTLSVYEEERNRGRTRRGRAVTQNVTQNANQTVRNESKLNGAAALNRTEPGLVHIQNSTHEPWLNRSLDTKPATSITDSSQKSDSLHLTTDTKEPRENEKKEKTEASKKTDNLNEEKGREVEKPRASENMKPRRKNTSKGSKHRIKTDTEEQKIRAQCSGQQQQHCGLPHTASPIGGAVVRERIPTPRTDEAVWAAAALGFLLVLLTLSVLHTRLYRHWRTPPSLYWQDMNQDYESVADIIRRRLKLPSRRKKRSSSALRRKECPLLLTSSNEEDSD